MSLVAAQDFAALIGVDREQKAQLAEGQLREGQTLFIVAPGLYSDARTASMGTSLIMAQQPPFHLLGDFSLVEDTGVPDALDQALVAWDLDLEV